MGTNTSFRDSGGSMFQNSSNVQIHGGTFNAYAATASRVERTMELLGSHAEKGAPYDAAARQDVPKCHEHTRVAIIEAIRRFALLDSEHPNAPSLMWMYGPAGSGKTTILQTVAEMFDTEHTLASSFFFSKVAAGRPKEKSNLIVTTAHQLAQHVPEIRPHIGDAFEPTILSKSLRKQLDTLVIAPINALRGDELGCRRVFLVDGLDECTGDSHQTDVLALILHFLRNTQHSLRFIIASRPYSHIQEFFSREDVASHTATLPLDDRYKPDRDILAYLRSEFSKIVKEHPVRESLPPDWPSHADTSTLVKRASGQFIYASTIMRYIADHGRHPETSLSTILDLEREGDATPFRELDALYTEIMLSVEPENRAFVKIGLGNILLGQKAYAVGVLDLFFGNPSGTTKVRMNRLRPLVEFKGYDHDTIYMRLSHASFSDYLLDPSRSRESFVDLSHAGNTISYQGLRFYSREVSRFRAACGSSSSSPYSINGRGKLNFKPVKLKSLEEREYRLSQSIFEICRAPFPPELTEELMSFDIEGSLAMIGGSRWNPKGNPLGSDFEVWIYNCWWDEIIYWIRFIVGLGKGDLCTYLSCKLKQSFEAFLQQLDPPEAPYMQHIAEFIALIPPVHAKDEILANFPATYRDDPPHRIIMEATAHIYEALMYRQLERSWGTTPTTPDKLMLQRDLLCHILSPSSRMENGSFVGHFDYTSLGNMMVEGNVIEQRREPLLLITLPRVLTRVPPSKELAMLVKATFLQVPMLERFQSMHQARSDGDPVVDELSYSLAVCLYIRQSGVPLFTDHQHPQGFYHMTWICAICLLFDPMGDSCPDNELSQDPLDEEEIGQDRAPANIWPRWNVERAVVWAQVWIVWLAYMFARFFPML